MNIKKIQDIAATKINSIRNIRLDQKTKLIISLIAFLLTILSPLLYANKPTQVAQAQNIVQSPLASPAATKTPEPSATVQPEQQTPPKPSAAEQKKSDAKTAYRAPSQASPKPKTTAQAPSSSQTREQESTYSDSQMTQPSGILGYINQARAANGLTALTYNSQLNSAAKAKSQDMFDKNYFAHTSPDGKSDFDFIKAAGYIYKFAGSNIAKGSFTEKSVFDAWMNSSGHRANILDPRAKEFGFGAMGEYYTMMVGSR